MPAWRPAISLTPVRSSTALATVLATLAMAGVPGIAVAQDRSTVPELEDLIPDSALDDPEAWAEQGVPPDAAETAEAPIPPELDTDAPMAELPDFAVPWPEDIELQALEELEPDESIEFAENPYEIEPLLEDGYEVEISDQLAIVLPSERSLFPEQDEFIDRFSSLSTIEELDSDEDNLAQLAARAREDEELLNRLLRIYGYYDAQIYRTVGGLDAGTGEAVAESEGRVRFDVVPGQQFTYGRVNLGRLSESDDYGDLRRTFEVRPGDPVLQDTIVQERFDLDERLGETGYVFAEIDNPELLIDYARVEGDLSMPVRPNGKYNFGAVTSDMPEFLSGEHLADIARFEPGDLYRRSDELDLRRAILATGLVSSVTITPREVEAPAPDDPGTVVMDVGITPAPLRTITAGIGYGTEEGFRVEGSWEHRNLFPPEGMLRVRGILGTQEQLAGITFRRNNVSGRDRVLTLDAYASTIDTVAYDARTVALTGTFERRSTLLFQKPLTWGVGAEVIATQEREATADGVLGPRQTYFIGAVFGSATIDTSDSLLNPTEGFRIGGRLSPEVSRTNEFNSFYVRSQVDGSYYQSIGSNIVAAGRVRVASIPGVPTEAVAPSRRLYAGGGGSVRGYGYQRIGPTNDLGDPSGGRSLLELSAEARVQTGFLDGAVQVVPFVDAGTVANGATPDFDEIKIGVGVGMRYLTGFGPIRVDVGVPLNPGPNDSPVAVYVGLGQAF